jgi:hypothetical protein
MNPIIRKILAAVAGILVGMIVNGGLITISSYIIPPPEGFDLTTTEGLQNGMKLMEPKHFIMPFLAHALGSLSGAFVAAYLAINQKMIIALLIGFLFMIGGIMMIMQLPSPLWFSILDLIGAYLPMAWLGARLAGVK